MIEQKFTDTINVLPYLEPISFVDRGNGKELLLKLDRGKFLTDVFLKLMDELGGVKQEKCEKEGYVSYLILSKYIRKEMFLPIGEFPDDFDSLPSESLIDTYKNLVDLMGRIEKRFIDRIMKSIHHGDMTSFHNVDILELRDDIKHLRQKCENNDIKRKNIVIELNRIYNQIDNLYYGTKGFKSLDGRDY